MTKHYLKVAVRNIIKFRLQTVVCITGLAVGMACFALGTLWLRHIESYEDFVPDADRVYLVTCGKSLFDNGYNYLTWWRDAECLQEKLPGVEQCVRCNTPYMDSDLLDALGNKTGGFKLLHCDSAFFDFYGIKTVAGSVAKLQQNEIVLTRSLARKLADDGGDGSAMLGKTMNIRQDFYGSKPEVRIVKAIVEDSPKNSQVVYEAIVLNDDSQAVKIDGAEQYFTFAKMKVGVVVDSLVTAQITLTEGGLSHPMTRTYELVPIRKWRTDYHSHSIKITTDYVRWFMILGLLVIGCSLCNYLITMVSHLRRRSWEMSLRRVLGSSRASIINMVCVETLLMFFLSAVAGLLLTWLALPYFREYSDIDLPLSSIALTLCGYLLLVIVFGVAVSALTAWTVMWRTQRNILSSRQLKHSSTLLDRFGVMLQMALSFGILFCVAVMLRQMNMLMYSDELGFSHNDRGRVYSESEEVIQAVRMSPMVEESVENRMPIFPRNLYAGITFFRSSEDNEKSTNSIEGTCAYVDSALVHFYDMKLIAGSMPVTVDKEDVCVSETTCRILGFTPEQAIGKQIWSYQSVYRICGVFKDVYLLGPTIEPEPAIYMFSGLLYGADLNTTSILFRTKPGRLNEFLDSIRAWSKQAGSEIEFYNLQNIEAAFNEYIASEQMLIKILLAVGLCSLFVCVIGTFSLVSLSLQQRRKEIAVRKVHGARVKDIMPLFIKSNVLSLLIAALLAYPLSYMLMRTWLDGYLKQVEISWWLFALTFLTVAVVVLSTIALKIWRAAKENPASKLHE